MKASKSKTKPVKADAPVRKRRPPIKKTGFYWSDEWRRIRYKALRASNGICECCGSLPSRVKPLHVDHIKPRSKYPELELAQTNLQVLCDDCNLGKGATDETDWRRAADLPLV